MKFSVSVPALDLASPRVAKTLRSIREQDFVRNGVGQVEIICISPRPAELGSNGNLFEASDTIEVSILRDRGRGLYSALGQSFRHHTGDYHSYLGAGDAYEPQAFTVVSEVLTGHAVETAWLTGMVVTRRQDEAIVRATLPFRYSRWGFRRGIYGRLAPGIQQESTWWTTELHDRIPLDELSRYRLAGDLFIWTQFAEVCAPVVVEGVLSSFTWHGDNMSQDWSGYISEVETMFRAPNLLDRLLAKFANLQWALPNRAKVQLGRGEVRRWAWPDGPWKGK